MKNKRNITIKVIHKEDIISSKLAKYFAEKYLKNIKGDNKKT